LPFTTGIDPICGSFFPTSIASHLPSDQFRSRFSRRAVADRSPESVYARIERHLTQFLLESKDLGQSKTQFNSNNKSMLRWRLISPSEPQPMEAKMLKKLILLSQAFGALVAFATPASSGAVSTFETDAETHLRFTEKENREAVSADTYPREFAAWVAVTREIRTLPLGLNARNQGEAVALMTVATNNPITRRLLLRPVGANNDTNPKETNCKKQLPGSAGIEQLHKCLA